MMLKITLSCVVLGQVGDVRDVDYLGEESFDCPA